MFLLRFVSNVALGIYVLCAIALWLSLRLWLRERREQHSTIYALEREVAASKARRALAFALFMIVIVLSVSYANDIVSVIPLEVLPTPTPPFASLFRTATATIPIPTSTPAPPTPTPLRPPGLPTPRVTPPPPPIATPVPPPPSCPNPNVRITSPGVDARLSGNVTIVGTATLPDFQFYKIEYGVGEQPTRWNVLGDLRRQPVSDGVLSTFNASVLPPGVYRLQLTVVDSKGQFPAPCSVRVVMGE
jgi:hypothetical protein